MFQRTKLKKMFGENISCPIPVEIVWKIFGFLGRDIFQAVLVNREWNLLLNDGRFWEKFQIRIDSTNLDQVLSSKRLKIVREVVLENLSFYKMFILFKSFAKNRTVEGKSLKICEVGTCFQYINPVDFCAVIMMLVSFEADTGK